MSESMSNVERVLWRIAELGARCSQHTAAGGRGPLWAELEHTIAGLDAEVEAARQAVDIAPAQVRTLEGRLDVAKKERDRERARAQECSADAEAARRERDRERQRSMKAKQAADAARATTAECIAQVAAAESARDHAVSALDQAVTAHEQTLSALDEAVTVHERTVATLDEALARVAELEADFEAIRSERDVLLAAQAEASAGRESAVGTLAARAEGAVVVLPSVALPEAQVGPVTTASRVSWQPTWSEWTGDDDATDDTEVSLGDEVRIDDQLEGDEGGTRRYLNVAATIGQLLPEDLGPLLLSGATVIRREGRLFATVGITTNPWATAGSDGEEQAQKFSEAGLRVEWTSDAPLAC
ncbi:MAG TPA: hypothetical protein VGR20_00945 [Acidimicrobiia bacterium]|nr:hypothetical protein [Acidimicrobiia bacterium]